MKNRNKLCELAIYGTFLLIFSFCVVTAAVRGRVEHTLPVGAWGLSFPSEGDSPIGNASKEQLAAYDAAFLGDTETPVIYLTFDAGYENGYTARILDTLKQHEVKAAFFVVGNYIEQNPALIKRMVDEGHIVGNHTYHHYDMSEIRDETAFAEELHSLEALYEETVGSPMPRFYRPPRGNYSEENLQMAKKLGYKTVFWSLAYVDWYTDDQPTSEEAFSKLIPRIHKGAVVLLHSTSSTNADILDALLTKWEQMGYRFAGIEELF